MSRVFHSSSSTGNWPGAVAAASGSFCVPVALARSSPLVFSFPVGPSALLASFSFPVAPSVFRPGVSFPVHDLNEGPHVQR